ncbi:MAG: hypothetical protein ACRDNW_17920 [Trebonia sp.]
MTDSPLHAALRAGAEGLCALEAGTGLIIAHGTWTGRPDFACHIHHGMTAAIPVRLGDAVTGIDKNGVSLLLDAIHRASGEPKGRGTPAW